MELILPAGSPKPTGVAGQSPNKNDKPTLEIKGVGYLPRDIIIEILSRLPVKDLCKFRCVSKKWHRLLYNDNQFIARHREISRRSPLLLFRKYSSDEKEEDSENNYRFSIMLTSMNIEGTLMNKVKASICGPVYTFTSSGPLVVLCCTYQVYVCNPSTKEFVSVPRSSVPRYFTIGFGYLPGSNEYKIVHLFCRDPFIGEEEMGCEVFTLRDGEALNSLNWKRIGDCPYTVPTNCSTVSVNGILYWKVSKQSEDSNNDSNSILSLNLETEKFGVISYPKCYADSCKKLLILTGFKGYLALVDCSSGTSAMEIWLLKNHGDQMNCWVKDYSVSLSGFDSKIQIKDFVPSNDTEGEILINTEQKGLGYYHIENKKFRGIKNSGIVEWYKKPCLYYDAFFSLHSAP